MNTATDRAVLTVPEAGAMLGVGRNKAYELARNGVIPTRKLMGTIVVPKERFMKWLNEEPSNDQPVEAGK